MLRCLSLFGFRLLKATFTLRRFKRSDEVNLPHAKTFVCDKNTRIPQMRCGPEGRLGGSPISFRNFKISILTVPSMRSVLIGSEYRQTPKNLLRCEIEKASPKAGLWGSTSLFLLRYMKTPPVVPLGGVILNEYFYRKNLVHPVAQGALRYLRSPTKIRYQNSVLVGQNNLLFDLIWILLWHDRPFFRLNVYHNAIIIILFTVKTATEVIPSIFYILWFSPRTTYLYISARLWLYIN